MKKARKYVKDGERVRQMFRIGRRLSEKMDHYASVEEIGNHFGMSPECADYHAKVALGKLASRLSKALGVDIQKVL